MEKNQKDLTGSSICWAITELLGSEHGVVPSGHPPSGAMWVLYVILFLLMYYYYIKR